MTVVYTRQTPSNYGWMDGLINQFIFENLNFSVFFEKMNLKKMLLPTEIRQQTLFVLNLVPNGVRNRIPQVELLLPV